MDAAARAIDCKVKAFNGERWMIDGNIFAFAVEMNAKDEEICLFPVLMRAVDVEK